MIDRSGRKSLIWSIACAPTAPSISGSTCPDQDQRDPRSAEQCRGDRHRVGDDRQGEVAGQDIGEHQVGAAGIDEQRLSAFDQRQRCPGQCIFRRQICIDPFSKPPLRRRQCKGAAIDALALTGGCQIAQVPPDCVLGCTEFLGKIARDHAVVFSKFVQNTRAALVRRQRIRHKCAYQTARSRTMWIIGLFRSPADSILRSAREIAPRPRNRVAVSPVRQATDRRDPIARPASPHRVRLPATHRRRSPRARSGRGPRSASHQS